MEKGWEIENRMHFDEIVSIYDRIRPKYPDKLISDIFNYVNLNDNKKALEIGAGTGKATTSFLDAGYAVTAVEIGANMAEFLQEQFKCYKNFEVINNSFEKTSLKNNTYDLIYAATAFHWVDAEIGCPKVFSLLKTCGTFALFRYNTVPADGDALYEEIQNVYKEYFHKPYVRPIKKSKDEYKNPSEIQRGFRFDNLEKFGFSDVTMKLYNATRTFSADDYISLLDTFSDHRTLCDSDRAALYNGVRETILKHGGQISVDYVFQLYMGRKCK